MSEMKAVAKAAEALKKGELVVVPTETVYGLAALIDKPEAIERIFTLKERPFFDPLIVHISKFKQIPTLVSQWPAVIDYLTRHCWPGPLTVVVPKSNLISPMITSGLDTVALRMPKHPLTLALLDEVNTPFAAPSANKFGKTSPTRPEHVTAEFKKETPYILDGGECDVGVESTVIQVLENGNIGILRHGGYTQEALAELLLKFSPPIRIESAHHSTSSAASPGHLEHHYMPDVPLLVFDNSPNWNDPEVAKFLSVHNLEPSAAVEFEQHKDPRIAARQLYQNLRQLSEKKPSFIWAQKHSHQTGGLWTALWDRLERASRIKFLRRLGASSNKE